MRFLGPRAGLSSVLIAGALVLLGAIFIGNKMGNGVLGQIGATLPQIAPTSLVPTSPPTPLGKSEENWKKTQIMAVATDPGFPDPRVTPEPPPPQPPPRPAPRRTETPKPTPAPQDTFDVDDVPTLTPSTGPSFTYTSPPLPLPIGTRGPSAEPSPDDTDSPRPRGRGTPPSYAAPTLPPIPVQTLNP